jgi:hypothetical protein
VTALVEIYADAPEASLLIKEHQFGFPIVEAPENPDARVAIVLVAELDFAIAFPREAAVGPRPTGLRGWTKAAPAAMSAMTTAAITTARISNFVLFEDIVLLHRNRLSFDRAGAVLSELGHRNKRAGSGRLPVSGSVPHCSVFQWVVLVVGMRFEWRVGLTMAGRVEVTTRCGQTDNMWPLIDPGRDA